MRAQKNKWLIFFCILFSTFNIKPAHKVIYVVAPPRNCSCAFLRMIQARGDFKIFHEPSQYAFNLIRNPAHKKNWFRENAPETFAEVKQKIFNALKEKNVFVKEVSFAVQAFLLNDDAFINSADVYFVFLIRNPHHATISFFQRATRSIPNLANLLGYQGTFDIFTKIKAAGTNKPIIILSEDFYQNPETTIKQFCKYFGIPFKEESLHWPDLGEAFSGIEEWEELKLIETTHHWHGDAIRSTGIMHPHNYAVDECSMPTFEEIPVEHRAAYIEAYLINKRYYDLLLNESDYLLKNID
jgi:hypothetical protein